MKYSRLFKSILAALLASASCVLGAQAKYALVVGNGDYSYVAKLKNPVNDAIDMGNALKSMGFQVDSLTNASLGEMEDAVVRLGNRLSQSKNAYGFFFYAGHGIQSNGLNYLIPVDVDIKSEAFLKSKALVVQSVLDALQQSGNNLNVLVLDACRDNPFSWARSASRGLSVMGTQPQGSIIVYATSAGATAQDGTGRNGLFTSKLLKNLAAPGMDVAEVFKRTGAEVMEASDNRQVPAVYSQFFKTAYLAGAGNPGAKAAAASESQPKGSGPSWGDVTVAPGSIRLSVATAGTASFLGMSKALPAGASIRIDGIAPGDYSLDVAYADGHRETQSVSIDSNRETPVSFTYRQASADYGSYRAFSALTPDIVFFDDFSDNRNGWSVESNAHYSRSIGNGRYTLADKEDAWNESYHAVSVGAGRDFEIELTANTVFKDPYSLIFIYFGKSMRESNIVAIGGLNDNAFSAGIYGEFTKYTRKDYVKGAIDYSRDNKYTIRKVKDMLYVFCNEAFVFSSRVDDIPVAQVGFFFSGKNTLRIDSLRVLAAD